MIIFNVTNVDTFEEVAQGLGMEKINDLLVKGMLSIILSSFLGCLLIRS